MLHEFAETRRHRGLVVAVHFEGVGNGAEVRDTTLAGGQQQTRAFAVLGARGVEFLERLQSGLQSRHLALARTEVALAPFALDAGRAERRLARRRAPRT